jgi:hypothetical protein
MRSVIAISCLGFLLATGCNKSDSALGDDFETLKSKVLTDFFTADWRCFHHYGSLSFRFSDCYQFSKVI